MLREIKELIFFHYGTTEKLARYEVENVYRKSICFLKKAGLNGIENKKLLDLGCGQRFPLSLQAAADGADVTALDINYIVPGSFIKSLYGIIKHNGIKRAVKSFIRRMLWDEKYYEHMERISGKNLRSYKDKIKFVVADPANIVYPLESTSFDVIMSNAVLEHVEHVEEYAKEVARLLKDGGYYYAVIHNYYSISGGHNTEWGSPSVYRPKNVDPWDHVRKRKIKAWTYLNELRPNDYVEAFEKHINIEAFFGIGQNYNENELEGEDLYTESIRNELSKYTKEELLTRAWCLIGRKKTI